MIKETYGMSAEAIKEYDEGAVVFESMGAFSRAVLNEVKGNPKLETGEQRQEVFSLVSGAILEEMGEKSVVTRQHVRQARENLGAFANQHSTQEGALAMRALTALSGAYTRKTDDMDVNVFSPDPKPINVPALIAKGREF